MYIPNCLIRTIKVKSKLEHVRSIHYLVLKSHRLRFRRSLEYAWPDSLCLDTAKYILTLHIGFYVKLRGVHRRKQHHRGLLCILAELLCSDAETCHLGLYKAYDRYTGCRAALML